MIKWFLRSKSFVWFSKNELFDKFLRRSKKNMFHCPRNFSGVNMIIFYHPRWFILWLQSSKVFLQRSKFDLTNENFQISWKFDISQILISMSFENDRHGFGKVRHHTFQKYYLLSDSLKLLKWYHITQYIIKYQKIWFFIKFKYKIYLSNLSESLNK